MLSPDDTQNGGGVALDIGSRTTPVDIGTSILVPPATTQFPFFTPTPKPFISANPLPVIQQVQSEFGGGPFNPPPLALQPGGIGSTDQPAGGVTPAPGSGTLFVAPVQSQVSSVLSGDQPSGGLLVNTNQTIPAGAPVTPATTSTVAPVVGSSSTALGNFLSGVESTAVDAAVNPGNHLVLIGVVLLFAWWWFFKRKRR